jgi:hypothetical protein
MSNRRFKKVAVAQDLVLQTTGVGVIDGITGLFPGNYVEQTVYKSGSGTRSCIANDWCGRVMDGITGLYPGNYVEQTVKK